MGPGVSLVIPAFNGAAFVEQALGSVHAQTLLLYRAARGRALRVVRGLARRTGLDRVLFKPNGRPGPA